jgi:ADP-ribose pyrophosphatase YjhB (NUDIX family)
VLAGFVEVGETLEQAVAREVMEESGIKVKNLRYVTSQPWPFPQSLMTAFMADYAEGDIVVDKKELLTRTGIAMTIYRFCRRRARWRAGLSKIPWRCVGQSSSDMLHWAYQR